LLELRYGESAVRVDGTPCWELSRAVPSCHEFARLSDRRSELCVSGSLR
jgi:hypothetical protein